MHAQGEEIRDDYRKALPKETVERSGYAVVRHARHGRCSGSRWCWSGWSPSPCTGGRPSWSSICVILIGTRQHALFVLAHEAAHYRLFERRGLNDFAGRLCATLQGLSMCTYRVIHRLHHNNLYGPADPDTALHGGTCAAVRISSRSCEGT